MAQKINADVMKQNNRQEILRLIRKEPCSRIKLAEKMGLTRAAISFICEELLTEGIIVEGEKVASCGGRPATVLHLNPEYGFFGGVHFTRSEYVVGICNFTGELIKEKKGKINPESPQKSLIRMRDTLRELLKGEGDLLGIGITAPGPLSREKRMLGEVPNFSAWHNFPIVEFFEREFECKCVLDNFSNALAYAEYSQNVDCERRYLELIIDSGFGSAVAVVKNGVSLLECELGHTSVNMFGERCDCGNIGCAELYVNEKKFYATTQEQVEFYSALASVIVNAINAFSIQQVIFAGCITRQFDVFSKRLQSELERRKISGMRLNHTVLSGKEIYVACNLFIVSTSI